MKDSIVQHFHALLERMRRRQPALEPLTPDCEAHDAGELIGTAILERRPFLASRLGYTEAQCLTQRGGIHSPSKETLTRIHRFSGVFPAERGEFVRFGNSYLEAIRHIDLLGLIETQTERTLVEKFAPSVMKCSLGALEPYFCAEPWSRFLKDLRVCVVHPFAQSIASQYANARERLFPGKEILPEFSLRLVKAPQTIAENTDGYRSWSVALEALKKSVLSEDFDVAILGCGAYGLPLGAHLKEQGKTVIHLGGSTQVLFGVSGARWRDNPAFAHLMNEFWKPPLESERPEGWKQVEDGCYW